MFRRLPSPIVSLVRPHRKILLHQPSPISARRRSSREQAIVTSSRAIEKPRENDPSSGILDKLETVSTSFVLQSPQIGPVCELRHKLTINRHDINRAIEVARRTSAAFTNYVPCRYLWTWLDGLDHLEYLQADDGSCMECFLVQHLRTAVGFPLLVSVVHTGDTEMLKVLLHVYDDIENCSEYVMRRARGVISARESEET